MGSNSEAHRLLDAEIRRLLVGPTPQIDAFEEEDLHAFADKIGRIKQLYEATKKNVVGQGTYLSRAEVVEVVRLCGGDSETAEEAALLWDDSALWGNVMHFRRRQGGKPDGPGWQPGSISSLEDLTDQATTGGSASEEFEHGEEIGRRSSNQGGLVFVCHSHVDKDRVRDLYLYLKRKGIPLWLDDEDLVPGQDWHSEIKRAIKASSFVLACISSDSIDRPGFVNRELNYAMDRAAEMPPDHVFLIPVRLEECPIPERLSHLHCADLFVRQGYLRLYRALTAKQFTTRTDGRSAPRHAHETL